MMMRNLKSIVLGMFLAGAATAVSADTVAIRIDHGDVVITGHLVSDKGVNYLIKTRFGIVQVAKSVASCDGCSPVVMALAD
ncbi:hypothetical protein [Halovulum sp. GXIMD14793]